MVQNHVAVVHGEQCGLLETSDQAELRRAEMDVRQAAGRRQPIGCGRAVVLGDHLVIVCDGHPSLISDAAQPASHAAAGLFRQWRKPVYIKDARPVGQRYNITLCRGHNVAQGREDFLTRGADLGLSWQGTASGGPGMRLILVLILCGLPMPALADGEKPVDVAIVVSYDRSESIDRAEAHTQIQGLIYTLRHPRFHAAVASGYFGRIALSAITWSSFAKQELIMPWMQIAMAQDARMAAIWLRKFRARGEMISHGRQTDVAWGIKKATEQMFTLPWWTSKKVINMVGDGISNIGRVATTSRDETIAAGTTINGLVMATGKAVELVSGYYRREVIGGPTSFVQLSTSNDQFAQAMLRKMTLEMVRLREESRGELPGEMRDEEKTGGG